MSKNNELEVICKALCQMGHNLLLVNASLEVLLETVPTAISDLEERIDNKLENIVNILEKGN